MGFTLLAQAAERPETPRDRRRRETTREIRERASALLAAEGAGALTVQRLAADLGYTPGALYRYFPSKDALLAELLSQLAEDLHQELLDAWGRAASQLGRREAAPSEAALLQLLVATRIWTAGAWRGPAAFSLLDAALRAPRPDPPGSGLEAAGPTLVKPFDHFVRLFEAAARARALRRGDARRRSAGLWAALHGVHALGGFGRQGLPRQRPALLTRSLIRGLLVGWGAEPAAVDAAQRRATALVRRPGRRSG